MKYKIALAVSGRHKSVDLTYEDFRRIKKTVEDLPVFVGIEEKFDLVLANYFEYERSLLDLTLHQLVYRKPDWQSYRSDFNLVNRRVVNLLTATRLYTDHISHDISGLLGKDSEIASWFQRELAKEYDSKLPYRTMEALRNVVQHSSLPVHRLGYPMSWENMDLPSSALRFAIVPSLEIRRLEGSKFKSAVLKELEANDARKPSKDKSKGLVLLTPLVREYIEGLARVHEDLRKQISENVAAAEATLLDVQKRALEVIGNEPPGLPGLSIVAEKELGLWVERIPIFLDLLEYRQALLKKNSSLSNFSQRYVSGAIEDRKEHPSA